MRFQFEHIMLLCGVFFVAGYIAGRMGK